MEGNFINNCVLCKKKLEKQETLFFFSCEHCFCFKCYPYILFNALKNSDISEHFFLNPMEILSNCLICKSGISSSPIPFTSLSNFMNKAIKREAKKKPEKIKCEICNESDIYLSKSCCINCENKYLNEKSEEIKCQMICHRYNKPSKFYCIDCHTYFCKYCNYEHEKFFNHKIISDKMKEKYQMFILKNLQNKYHCPTGHILHSFCLDCKSSDCIICMNINHNNHQVRPIDEIFTKNNNFKYENSISDMSDLLDDFSKFQENLYNNAENSMKDFNKELDEVIIEMICSLNKLKSNIYEKMNKNYENLQSQTDLIQKSLIFLRKEIENNEIEVLHPNKLFQLNRYFNESKLKIEFSFKNFHIRNEKLEDLK